jgi:hypothetical protein
VVAVAITVENKLQFRANGTVIIHDIYIFVEGLSIKAQVR